MVWRWFGDLSESQLKPNREWEVTEGLSACLKCRLNKEHELEVYGGEGGKDCGKTSVLAHWAMIISRKPSNNKYLVMRDLLCTFAHFIIHHNKILLLK